MHGAARLMFGQNPEVLPTKTPITTTPINTPLEQEQLTQSPTIISASSASSMLITSSPEKLETNILEKSDPEIPVEPNRTEMPVISPTLTTKHHLEQTPEVVDVAPETAVDNAASTDDGTTPHSLPAGPLPGSMLKSNRKMLKSKKEEEPPRQVIGDVIVEEIADLRRKPTARRSVSLTPMSRKVFITIPLSASDLIACSGRSRSSNNSSGYVVVAFSYYVM